MATYTAKENTSILKYIRNSNFQIDWKAGNILGPLSKAIPERCSSSFGNKVAIAKGNRNNSEEDSKQAATGLHLKVKQRLSSFREKGRGGRRGDCTLSLGWFILSSDSAVHHQFSVKFPSDSIHQIWQTHDLHVPLCFIYLSFFSLFL